MSKRKKNKRLEISKTGLGFIEDLNKSSWSGQYVTKSKEIEKSKAESVYWKYYYAEERPSFPDAIVLPEPEKPRYPLELAEFIHDYMNELRDDLYPFLYEFAQKTYGIGKYGIVLQFVTLSGHKFIQIVELSEGYKYFTAEIEQKIIENLITAIALRTRTKDEIKARAVI